MIATQHIVNVSGGKDSTATYLLAMERGVQFRAVMADTGNEHEWTMEYAQQLGQRTGGPEVEFVRADFTEDFARKRLYVLEKWAGKGVPNEVIERAARVLEKPTGIPFLDLCIWKGRFPSRMAQFCTDELKVVPITTQIILPALRTGRVLQWLGIRADESAKRAKDPRFNRHDCGCYLYRPLLRYTIEDVWAMHDKHGLKRNPLYDNGMGRVGCMLCMNCRKDEIREVSIRFPQHIDKLREWEWIVGQVSKRGLGTFFPAVTDPTDVDRPGTYAGIDTIVEWSRTARGGRQYAMFFDEQTGGGCSNDMGLCELVAA